MPIVRASIVSLASMAFAFAACTTSDPASPESAQGPGSFAIDGGYDVPIDAGYTSKPDGGIVDSGGDSDSARSADTSTAIADASDGAD